MVIKVAMVEAKAKEDVVRVEDVARVKGVAVGEAELITFKLIMTS